MHGDGGAYNKQDSLLVLSWNSAKACYPDEDLVELMIEIAETAHPTTPH